MDSRRGWRSCRRPSRSSYPPGASRDASGRYHIGWTFSAWAHDPLRDRRFLPNLELDASGSFLARAGVARGRSGVDRPQHSRARARDAALVPSAPDGLRRPESMPKVLSVEAWYVLATLLAPIGYVVQDVVADAMTVEAVPRVDAEGRPVDMAARKSMNTTVQTLGRVAIIGGTVLVSLANVYLLQGVGELPEADKALAYLRVYELALIIPVVSVLGVGLGLALRWRDTRRLVAKGFAPSEARRMLNPHGERVPINWWILGGGLAFAIVSVGVGLGDMAFGQELVFGLSMAVLVFLIWRITGELEPEARHVLVGTAIVVFVFRAVPGPGAGGTWWEID